MAKREGKTPELGTRGRGGTDPEAPIGDADVLTEAAGNLHEAGLWVWNAWCWVDWLSEGEANDKLYADTERLHHLMMALKADLHATLKSSKQAKPTPMSTVAQRGDEKRNEADPQAQGGAQPAAKKVKPAKTAPAENAEARLKAKPDTGKKVVKSKVAKGRR